MPVTLSTITFRDGLNNNQPGTALDQSGVGVGPFVLASMFLDGVAGANRGLVTALNALKIDGSGVASPASGTLTANIGTAGPLMIESGGNLAALGGTVAASRLGTKETRSGTAAQTTVASSVTSVTLLASNAARLGAAIFYDATTSGTMFVLLGSGPASATNYTTRLNARQRYEVPFGYTGAITAIWSSALGNARITEQS